MQFIHQPLTWAFLIALVPLLIHLINMMRHRRVQWAAMEFLLASYKKHRKWVWLKQLLLLLARMAAIALIVAMLAQLKTRDQWLAIFGGRAAPLCLARRQLLDERPGGWGIGHGRPSSRGVHRRSGKQRQPRNSH
jgi:hypothetical protein